MDFTSRMAALLSELRRERNGAAADAMRVYGKAYGLNMGVAIHTIRAVIADLPRDHQFAEYLYLQDIRELRIAALWMAESDKIKPESFGFWADGIINSEVAEQAAMALLCKIDCLDDLMMQWSSSEGVLPIYSALLSLSRKAKCNVEKMLPLIFHILGKYSDNRLIAQGIVAAMTSLYEQSPAATKALIEKIKQEHSATASYITDELSWRVI